MPTRLHATAHRGSPSTHLSSYPLPLSNTPPSRRLVALGQTNWLRFWLISATRAASLPVAAAAVAACQRLLLLPLEVPTATATTTKTATVTATKPKLAATILSALKRCNYFMPDNNLILSTLNAHSGSVRVCLLTWPSRQWNGRVRE